MQKIPSLEVIACVNDMCCSGFSWAVARFDERYGKKCLFALSVFYCELLRRGCWSLHGRNHVREERFTVCMWSEQRCGHP